MTVRELKDLLDLCDDDLDVCFDMESVEGHDSARSEDPHIESGQYVEDGFTESYFPSKAAQHKAESAYLLLKG